MTSQMMPESNYKHVETIDLSNDEPFEILDGVQSIGSLALFRCSDFSLPEGVVQINAVIVDESYLDLPQSVRRVGRILLQRYDDCLSCGGVHEFGVVQLKSSNLEFSEGVEAIGALQVDGSECRLPSSLKTIGDVSIDDDYRCDRGDGDEPAFTIVWKEGPTAIGALELGVDIAMSLPRSIGTIASVHLARGSHLRLPQETVILGKCEVADNAIVERLPASDYNLFDKSDLPAEGASIHSGESPVKPGE